MGQDKGYIGGQKNGTGPRKCSWMVGKMGWKERAALYYNGVLGSKKGMNGLLFQYCWKIFAWAIGKIMAVISPRI